MFLKQLIISKESSIIREINFRKGINLIIDETFQINKTDTGNDVGKTTVLKLIDFCLGAKPNGIYVDPESKKDEYKLVKDYLRENKIIIALVMTDDIDDSNAREITIERNFLSRKDLLRRINGQDLTEDEFEHRLLQLIFPNHNSSKPTFRQIISHNIRYEDENINNTLKTLNKFTTDVEYETLHLFLLGCEFEKGNLKQELILKLQQEISFKSRLEKKQTRTAYEAALSLLDDEISKLNKKRASLNQNENFEADLNKLDELKFKINILSSEISKLKIRRDIILEAKSELENNISKIDLKQLEIIYHQATDKVTSIQKTFEDLVAYHNRMIFEKISYMIKELPALEQKITDKSEILRKMRVNEKALSQIIAKSNSFEELENLIIELNEKFRKKGEFETTIQQLNEVEKEIDTLNTKLGEIDEQLFSDNFEQIVKHQTDKFNKHFAAISTQLYGEAYALKYDIVVNAKGQKIYKFNTFNTNFSSGKKQGEIVCFDVAYTFFADEEKIPCLHFLLYDRKELMHDNQLAMISELINGSNIQFVASILKDKLPPDLNDEKYFILKLSQNDKLFRIEK